MSLCLDSGHADRDGSVALVRLPGITYAVGTEFVALERVAPSEEPKTKKLPDEFITPEDNYITDRFLAYVAPLVGDLPKAGWFEQIQHDGAWGWSAR